MPPLYFPPGEAPPAPTPALEIALEAAAEAPDPPRAFLGALEATVLAAPPSPLVRTIVYESSENNKISALKRHVLDKNGMDLVIVFLNHE